MGNRLIDLNVLDSDAYFRKLPGLIRAAKKDERIMMMSMSFDADEPRVVEVMQELSGASKRGVEVTLALDAFVFMVNHKTDLPTGPLYLGRNIHSIKSAYYRDKLALLDDFTASGGRYKIINMPQKRLSVPHAGRSHIKAAVIGSSAYLGGTCGLGHSGQTDLVLQTSHPKATATIEQLIQDTYKKGSVEKALAGQDRETVLDSRTTLLLDSGIRGQSLIFERALDLIDSAEEWLTMTCQYFPNAATARHLEAARRRGVKVRLHYNHPSRHGSATVLGHRLVLLHERARYNKELFSLQTQRTARRIHAKLIATEKGAIIGSHNYVTAGVKLGTAEASILRLDPAFAKKAASVAEKALAK